MPSRSWSLLRKLGELREEEMPREHRDPEKVEQLRKRFKDKSGWMQVPMKKVIDDVKPLWRTPDGRLYLLNIGTATPAATMAERSRSISSLGRILRQLQTGKTPTRSRLHVALPRLHKHAKHPQSSPLKVLIGHMVHRNMHKRPYSMAMVKQELQHLMTQHIPPKKRRFSRRTLFRLGGLAGLARW